MEKKIGKGKTCREVTFPTSISYNGGIGIDGVWYRGYEVGPPIVPEGYELVGIGVGYQLNARPPYATQLLRRKKARQKQHEVPPIPHR